MIYKNFIFKVFTFLISSTFGICIFAQPPIEVNTKMPEMKTSISYCNLNLSEGWQLANLSFNSLYSFTVNKEGDVINVEKVRDNFIGEEEVRSCVSKWSIKGFPEDSRFAVYFVWKHGKGWIRQEISGNGFTQVMSIEDFGVNKLITSEISVNAVADKSKKSPY